jgi:H+/Cl- antiporter ClcA
MIKRLTEPTVLFISIIKWVFLATMAGAVVGGATAIFLKILAWATGVGHNSQFTLWLLPVALFISALLVKYLAPDAEGHGTEKVIEAIHKRSGKIPFMVVPVKLVATIITLAFGGSAGKEGPCAQIGAGLTSFFSNVLRFDEHDRKKLVICGISAGFAAVFGTPIAGSIFGVEVLFIGAILYDVLLPSFIAGITAYQVSSFFGISFFYEPVNVIPVFSEWFLLKVIASGIFFGICSIVLIETIKFGGKLSNKVKIWTPFKGIIGGVILIMLSFLFSTCYLGLGLESIQSCLKGNTADWYAFLVKPIFTSITLNFGGSGGIITPIFYTGAAAGTLFAKITGLSIGTFAAIGFVSVLAGSANTPIAASIMAVEMFGPAIAPYATVACVISFLMTGHRSVYPSQVLSISKSSSLEVELGKELENIQSSYYSRRKSLIQQILFLVKRIEDLVRKQRNDKN